MPTAGIKTMDIALISNGGASYYTFAGSCKWYVKVAIFKLVLHLNKYFSVPANV